jgi:hypothetical protein
MTFATIALVLSILLLALGAGWLFSGGTFYKQWGIGESHRGTLGARRIGAIYLGLGLMLYLARTAPPSELRTAVCAGVLAVLVLLALLGAFEFFSRKAGAGMLSAVLVESLLAGCFAWVLFA